MIRERTDVSLPPDSTALWRYQDLAQFLAILQRRALFMPVVQLLADPFEGSQTRRAVFFREIVLLSDRGASDEVRDATRRHMRERSERLWEEVCVSCWHASDHESEAMWKLYGAMGRGVAVRTSVGRLKAILERDSTEFVFAEVRYLDDDAGDAGTVDDVLRFLRKRKAFAHEREVRFLAHPSVTRDYGLVAEAERAGGIEVLVEPAELVERVHVAPDAPAWHLEVVAEAVRRHGYAIPVEQSALTARPLF